MKYICESADICHLIRTCMHKTSHNFYSDPRYGCRGHCDHNDQHNCVPADKDDFIKKDEFEI